MPKSRKLEIVDALLSGSLHPGDSHVTGWIARDGKEPVGLNTTLNDVLSDLLKQGAIDTARYKLHARIRFEVIGYLDTTEDTREGESLRSAAQPNGG